MHSDANNSLFFFIYLLEPLFYLLVRESFTVPVMVFCANAPTQHKLNDKANAPFLICRSIKDFFVKL